MPKQNWHLRRGNRDDHVDDERGGGEAGEEACDDEHAADDLDRADEGTHHVRCRDADFREAAGGQWWLFQVSLFIVFTMYGGGFATIPAFLADIFGPQNVGAIHGALLTAWSVAAIAGPVIITELSNSAKATLPPGADRVNIYDVPLQVLAGLLAVGFVLTLLVRPLRRPT